MKRVCGWLVLVWVCAGTVVALPPRDVFFSDPDRTHVGLSPDGQRLAYLSSIDGVLNLWVSTLGRDDARPVTNLSDRPVAGYAWAEDSSHLLFLRDFGGDENHQLFAVHVDTGRVRNLTPIEGAKVSILQLSDRFPGRVLILINDRDPKAFDVCCVEIDTGERETIYRNERGFYGFLADDAFVVRAAVEHVQDGSLLHVRTTNDESFQPLERYDAEDVGSIDLLAATDEALYYADAKERDKSALKRYIWAEGRSEVIFGDEQADLQGALFDPATDRPQAALTYGAQQQCHLLDPSFEPHWRHIEALKGEGSLCGLARSKHHPLWLVATMSDRSGPRYYLYDSIARRSQFLFAGNAQLEKLALAPTEVCEIEARDGLQLTCYLTRPPGVEGPVPMVLYVHGGPWARDRFEYDPYRQWLVSRGYAVLNVNFRGSTGFGKHHLNAGDRQWAGKMHDDLVDAVEWAVANRIADPDRIAIMGGSYGGYAALVGLTFTPELFAAAVDIVGPSHIKSLVDSFPPYWESMRTELERRVAPLDDESYMDAISPLTYVDRICRPLLILQGENDPRVKAEQSELIARAMQRKGLPVTYVIFPDEGHGFRKEKNRLASCAIVERFLAAHLGGECEPVGNAFLESSAQLPVGGELVENPWGRLPRDGAP